MVLVTTVELKLALFVATTVKVISSTPSAYNTLLVSVEVIAESSCADSEIVYVLILAQLISAGTWTINKIKHNCIAF